LEKYVYTIKNETIEEAIKTLKGWQRILAGCAKKHIEAQDRRSLIASRYMWLRRIKKELELGRITEDEAKYLTHITDMPRQKYNSKIINKTIHPESRKNMIEKYWGSKLSNES
jgi:hypothetical protein